ncbi:nucleoside-diphosphate kinase [Candidatus Gottesmanbacteria bacterium]|nr:nucleoside-diphosphate kinase [Candidatus Gottesmanbacteria bacterium]
MERSVVLIKPDGMKKRVIGEVINRMEKSGLKVVGLKMIKLSDALLDVWYAHHKQKPYFAGIKSYMMSTPVVAMIWEGDNAVKIIRDLAGPTDSTKAAKGTIRGDLGKDIQENVIHASDSKESAEKEVSLMFQPDEIHEL